MLKRTKLNFCMNNSNRKEKFIFQKKKKILSKYNCLEIIVIEMTILPSPPKWIIALKSSSSTMIICENKLQWSLSRYASQWQDCKRVFQFSFTANTFRLWISRHHNNNRGLNREQRSRRSCPLSNALCIKHCRRKQERGIPFEAVDKVYIRVIGASVSPM